jgi:hypothetical protein
VREALVESQTERRARLAANESLYRVVNEKLEDLNRTLTPVAGDGSMVAVCECGDISCAQQIELPVDVYERVRADSTLFIVAPGHEIADVEQIVNAGNGFTVVCKDKDPGKAIAERTDPRA